MFIRFYALILIVYSCSNVNRSDVIWVSNCNSNYEISFERENYLFYGTLQANDTLFYYKAQMEIENDYIKLNDILFSETKIKEDIGKSRFDLENLVPEYLQGKWDEKEEELIFDIYNKVTFSKSERCKFVKKKLR